MAGGKTLRDQGVVKPARGFSPDEVQSFDKVLSAVSVEEVKRRNVAHDLKFVDLDQPTQQYYARNFELLRNFVHSATGRGSAMIIYYR